MLPEEYKTFLSRVGNGAACIVNGQKRLVQGFRRPIYKAINKRWSMPFLLRRAFDAEKPDTYQDYLPLPKTCRDPLHELDEDCTDCPEFEGCVHSWSEDEEDVALLNGSMCISCAGCDYYYYLILNGPFRGEMWLYGNYTFYEPIKGSFDEFLDWISSADVI